MQLGYSERTRQPETESTNKITFPDITLGPHQQEDRGKHKKDLWKKKWKEIRSSKIDWKMERERKKRTKCSTRRK